MLALENISSFYGKTPIIQGMSFSIPRGGCLCVLGRNGVGKTTLLQTIMGLTSRMTGTLKIDGVDVSQQSTAKRALAGVGYVPQGRRILGKFTVRENIQLGTFARRDKKRGIPEVCLDLFPYLADNLDKKAGLLSGGEQQQLAFARALATDPQLLLLDEPTEGIQPNIVAEIEAMLQRLIKDLGMTMLITEQHIRMAKSLADHFIMMDVGRIVSEGKIESLTDDLIQKHMTI